jgi:hypothetical protein
MGWAKLRMIPTSSLVARTGLGLRFGCQLPRKSFCMSITISRGFSLSKIPYRLALGSRLVKENCTAIESR